MTALLPFALLLASQAVAEQPAAPEWVGAWRGTIGALPVSVCLEAPRESWTHGAYYYHSRMRSIGLERQADASWIEHGEGGAEITGTWRIANEGADRLRGEWQAGGRQLPVALERVPVAALPDPQTSPCGTREFFAPRIRPATLVQRPLRLGSFDYTGLTWNVGPGFADVVLESFEFPAARPGDAPINAALRLDPDKLVGAGAYLSCVMDAMQFGTSDGDYQVINEPIHASRAFIGVKAYNGGYCGGAHPFHSYGYQTWDRETGGQIQLGEWLRPEAFARVRYPGSTDTSYQATPAFARFLASHIRFDEPECRSMVEEEQFWDIGLTDTGMIFTPGLSYAATPCIDDAAIPYAQLTRWLNSVGRAGVARARRAP